MFLIKQYIITHLLINKLMKIMKKSKNRASNIGTEFSLFYFFIFNNNYSSDIPINYDLNSGILPSNYKDGVYYLINKLNLTYNLNISNQSINYINLNDFINLFNVKLFKLDYSIIFSFLRGYYLNNLILYSTNINKNSFNNIKKNLSLYFVLYDFHDLYLTYIYRFILNNTNFNPKLKFLLNTGIDKYSINELTDKIPYKLVFLHKTKYYHNISYILLKYIFKDVYDISELNEDELYVYNIFTSIK